MEPLFFGTIMTMQNGDLHRYANSALPDAPISPDSPRRRPLRRILSAVPVRRGRIGRAGRRSQIAFEPYATRTNGC